MKNLIICTIAIAALFAMLPLMSYDVSPPCYKQIQTTFFNPQLVIQALGVYSIDQSLWRFINSDLQNSMGAVPAMVQAEAQLKNPNPLAPPFNNDEAFKILQRVLYRVWYSVVIKYQSRMANSLINNASIQGSFNFIWLQQQAAIVQCLRR